MFDVVGDIGNKWLFSSKDYYFDSYAHFGIHEVKNNRIVDCRKC